VDGSRQLKVVRFGVIGTAEGVRRFNTWSTRLRGLIDVPPPGLRSRAIEPQHVPFPGFAEAFHAEWPETPSAVVSDLDASAIDKALHLANRHEAVRKTVDLFVSRLVSENNRLEHPPAVWFVVIPEAVYELGRRSRLFAKAIALPATSRSAKSARASCTCSRLCSAMTNGRPKSTSMRPTSAAS
jgi:hypothetical protein